MSVFVTLAEVKGHLFLTWPVGDPRDADLQLKLDVAEDAIVGFLNAEVTTRDVVAGWQADPTTAPVVLKGIIQLECGELWRFRGDDAAPDVPHRDPATDFSPTVLGLLRRLVGPVCA
jgi:hypothetical protein